MAVYEYKGVSYELADGISNEEALAKIKAYVGETPKETKAPEEKKDFAYNTTNPLLKGLLDIPVGVGQLFMKGAEGITSGFGLAPNKVSEAIGAESRGMDERIRQAEEKFKEANPDFSWGRLGGNIVGGVITAPATAITKAPMLARAAVQGAAGGAMQPVVTDDYWAAKGGQVATGTILGPLTEGGVKAVGALSGLVKGLTPKGREEALKKYLNELAGPERDKVVASLQDAAELVTGSRPTSAEALANIPSSAELVAAQAKLAKQPGVANKFASRSAEQQAARVRLIDKIAGTEAQRAAVAAKRSAVTSPLRETALEQSDVAGKLVTTLEKKIADDFNALAAAEQTAGMVGMAAKNKQATALAGKPGWLTAGDIAADAAERSSAYSGKAQTLRANARLKQYQLQSLEDNGFFPLRASDLVDQIDKAISGTTSDLSKDVLTNVRKTLLSKADENGILSSRDVYENVRKALNTDVASFLTQGEKYAAGGVPQQAAKTAGNIKSFIDSALDKSSDGTWSKYLGNYKAYSDKLNRMEVGDYLSKRLQTPLDAERAGVFATAVENAAGTIKKSTGIPRYDRLDQVLTPKETASVNAVLADLTRKVKAEQLASKVGRNEPGLVNPAGEIPQTLNKWVAWGKAAIEHLQRGNQKDFNAKMAELMLDPKQMATFMTTAVPKGRINEFTTALMKNMDEPTKAAFIQSFTVPTAAGMVGGTIE